MEGVGEPLETGTLTRGEEPRRRRRRKCDDTSRTLRVPTKQSLVRSTPSVLSTLHSNGTLSSSSNSSSSSSSSSSSGVTISPSITATFSITTTCRATTFVITTSCRRRRHRDRGPVVLLRGVRGAGHELRVEEVRATVVCLQCLCDAPSVWPRVGDARLRVLPKVPRGRGTRGEREGNERETRGEREGNERGTKGEKR